MTANGLTANRTINKNRKSPMRSPLHIGLFLLMVADNLSPTTKLYKFSKLFQ